jgi:hypothetical protein
MIPFIAGTSAYVARLVESIAQGIPPTHRLGGNYTVLQILQPIVGGLGLITVAPRAAVPRGLTTSDGGHS